MFDDLIAHISEDLPVLIHGPTASGKSALALKIAEAKGGKIVNADASQVYACWQVITARPPAAETSRAPHHLYGHVDWDQSYSAGAWLREAEALLSDGQRPIFVGGTGLYFMALTEGLSSIPATPPEIRLAADTKDLAALIADLDACTRAGLDLNNRARVQRAWEVQRATGRSLAQWQAETPAPLLPAARTHAFAVDAPKGWLTPRIEARFDQMLDMGAMDEIARMAKHYDPALQAFKAIGVPELMAHFKGEIDLPTARVRAIIATRQYAKRQRTWARKRCKDWNWVNMQDA